jgi:hypothetical protein
MASPSQRIFSVADFGLGIPDKVRSKVPEISDTAAIIKATSEEGPERYPAVVLVRCL